MEDDLILSCQLENHHKIEDSKHFVLKLPFQSYAEFNGIKIYGITRKNYDHFSVHNRADSLPLTHDDLDKLGAKYGEDYLVILEHRALLLSRIAIIFIVLLALIVLTVFGNMIFCILRCRYSNARQVSKNY